MERLKAFLFPILSQLNQDDVFDLSSDHGFIDKTGYHYKDTPRYVNGGIVRGSGLWRLGNLRRFERIV